MDTKKEHIAVGEARKLNIPVVAVLDTNCDPDEVDYPVPGNDDAIRSAALLTKVVAEAVAEGLLARSGGGTPAPRRRGAARRVGARAARGAAAEASGRRGRRGPHRPGSRCRDHPGGHRSCGNQRRGVHRTERARDVVAETESAAQGLAELQADEAEGLVEVVPGEQSGAPAGMRHG